MAESGLSTTKELEWPRASLHLQDGTPSATYTSGRMETRPNQNLTNPSPQSLENPHAQRNSRSRQDRDLANPTRRPVAQEEPEGLQGRQILNPANLSSQPPGGMVSQGDAGGQQGALAQVSQVQNLDSNYGRDSPLSTCELVCGPEEADWRNSLALKPFSNYKDIASGCMDVSLFFANASRTKALYVSKDAPFAQFTLKLLYTSLVLQVVLFLSRCLEVFGSRLQAPPQQNQHQQDRFGWINYGNVVLAGFVVLLNVFITVFGESQPSPSS